MKDRRLMKIREIVRQRAIETQEELVQALEDEGYPVTQATISRDIKELQLIKVVENGKYKYAIPQVSSTYNQDSVHRKLADVYVSLARAKNLLILKVMPGNAHAIGAMIDAIDVDGLLGTIAGDDTLLFIAADDDTAVTLEQWLRAED